MPVGCQTALTSDLNSHPNISVERAPYSRSPTVELRDELTCDQWEGDFKIAVKEKKLLKSKKWRKPFGQLSKWEGMGELAKQEESSEIAVK